MRRCVLKGLLGASALLTSLSVFAADLPLPAEPAPPEESCVDRWSCFYFGANLGAAWLHDSEEILVVTQSQEVFDVDGSDLGATAGVQIGWNVQSEKDLVFGVEADLNYLGLRRKAQANGSYLYTDDDNDIEEVDYSVAARHRLDWFGTLRARIGVLPSENLLVYATGGLAAGHTRTSLSLKADGVQFPPVSLETSESDIRWGWTVGAGLEYALDANWSIKAEYLYVDLKDTDFSATLAVPDPAFDVTGTVHDKNRFSVVRAGVNYKF